MSRISPGTLTVGIIAVLVALSGAYALRVYLQPAPEPATQAETPPEPRVPVASLDLPPGRKIQLGDIALQPRSRVKEIKPNTMSNPEYIIGRVLKQPLKVGETFTTTNLYPEGEGPTLSDRLQPGFRAVTVPVANFDAVAGYVAAGTMVDVLFRSKPGEGQGGYAEIPEITVTLAEAVEVLAVGKNPHGPTTDDRAQRDATVLITLACRRNEANKLRAVEGRGDLALALRAKDDANDLGPLQKVGLTTVKQTEAKVSRTSARGITLQEILGVEAKSEPIQTEVFRRGQRSVNVFDEHGRMHSEPQQTSSNTTYQLDVQSTLTTPAETN